jgi:hypothetical protein
LEEKRGFCFECSSVEEVGTAAKDVKVLATELGKVEFNHYNYNWYLNLRIFTMVVVGKL